MLVNHDEHSAACDSDQFVSACPLSDGVCHYLCDYSTIVSFTVELHRKHRLFIWKKCSAVHSVKDGNCGGQEKSFCFCCIQVLQL